MARKTADEKAKAWYGSYKETPRPGVKGFGHSTHKDIPDGITLSNVTHVSPNDLAFHPLNEKFFKSETKDYFEKLTLDIKERGILVPLITKPDGTLLAGHNRLKIALELGLSTVPLQRVIDELSSKQEKEFLIKDNYLRRQLTASEKEHLIRELYGEEIQDSEHGGQRQNTGRSVKKRIKVQLNLEKKQDEISLKTDSVTKKSSKSLADKIELETGIKKGTAKRIIAKIKKEDKSKVQSGRMASNKSTTCDQPVIQQQDPVGLSSKEQKQKDVLTLKLTTLEKTKVVLKKKLKDTEKEQKIVLNKLKLIGQKELF